MFISFISISGDPKFFYWGDMYNMHEVWKNIKGDFLKFRVRMGKIFMNLVPPLITIELQF